MTFFRGALLALACLGLTACSPAGGVVDVSAGGASNYRASAPLAGLAPGSPGGVYRVQPGDVIDVAIFQLPDLNRTAEIDGAGNVNLALIGAVPAAGRSVRQLEEEIAGRYRARYLQNPQISVSVKDAVGLRVTVDGAVKRPGVVIARGDMTLLRVLAEAQGFNDVADQSNVIVMRNSPQGRTVARFDANAIRAGTTPDPAIIGGDTIVVDDSTAKTVWKQFREALPVANLFRVL